MMQLDMIGRAAQLTAGVDEAGRGPLAGPVIAAAVILHEDRDIAGIKDSKQLTAMARERLAEEIKAKALSWGIGRADINEIDDINILQASLLAMRRAVAALTIAPQLVLVDGDHCPELDCQVRAIVRGDQTITAISAASILAKVSRDLEMEEMDRLYPGYGFARHKGYPTRQHLEALASQGICAIHRRSFGPVRRYL
ncbi:MAG: Ribonuclease H [Gammaproteobacteria bacterium]|nr:Ribonuclease H [Gammaproteobacteria bacterium]